MSAAVFIIIFLAVGSSSALRVYDCQHPATQQQVLDLTEPKKCPDPERSYEPERNVTLQIIQIESKIPVVATQCIVSVSRSVTRCGFDSIAYAGTRFTEWERLVELTPEECRKMTLTGKYALDGRTFDVEEGTQASYTYYTHGFVDSEGNCRTEPLFKSGGVVYYDSFEQTVAHIELRSMPGMADAGDQSVIFDNGLRAKYPDGVLRDAHIGTLVWEPVDPSCEDTASEIYLGPGLLHRVKGDSMLDSLVMVANETSGQYAGLILRQPQSICRVRCFSTQNKGLTVCLLREHDEPVPKAAFKEHFDVQSAAVQTQLSYLHLSSSLQTRERFVLVQAALCEVERKTLYNKLQAVAGSRNPYSLLDLYGPGHEVINAGAAAYVLRCVPVEAVPASFGNCTREIPVHVNGTVRFADPFTWVLRDFPAVVPCSKVMPVHWKIRGRWYCAVPDAILCERPMQLNASVRFPAFADFTAGVGQSAFTSSQMEAHAAFQRAFMAREAVIQQITNNAVEGSHSRGRLGMPLGKEDLESLEQTLGTAFVPFFQFLGSAWPYISAILALLIIVAGIIDSIGRVLFVYSRRGWGAWLVPALFQTTFVIFTAPLRGAFQGTRRRNEEDFEAFRDEPVPGQVHHGQVTYARLAEQVAMLLHRDRGRAVEGGPPTAPQPPDVAVADLNEQQELFPDDEIEAASHPRSPPSRPGYGH